LPKVVDFCDWLCGLINFKGVVLVLFFVACLFDDQIDLGNLETGDGYVEIAIDG
jgi:hypothetical protein